MKRVSLPLLTWIYFVSSNPIAQKGGLGKSRALSKSVKLFRFPGVLDITDTNDLSVRQRFEDVIRLDCASQRRKALNRKNSGDPRVYVPTCSEQNSL